MMPISHGTMARAPARASLLPFDKRAEDCCIVVSPEAQVVRVDGRARRCACHPPGPGASAGIDLDGDRHSVGDDVEDRRAGPRLLDQLAQLLGGGVAPYVEG